MAQKTIKQLKEEWAKASTKTEKDKIHVQADKLRGFTTETTVTNGKYYQTPKRMEGQLTSKADNLLTKTEKKQPLTPSSFRNASGLTKISPEQQEKNTQTLLKELKGKQGNLATDIMGVTGGFATGGFNKLFPNDAMDKRVFEQDKKNTFKAPFIKNPRAAMSGLALMEIKQANIRRSDVGSTVGQLIAADPVGILAEKGVRLAISRIALKSKVAPKMIEAALKNGDQAMTEAVRKELKLLPSPRPNLNESKLIDTNKVIAGNQILDHKFMPKPKDEVMQDIAKQIGNMPNPNYAPGLHSKGLEQKLGGLSKQLNEIDKMSDTEYIRYATENGLGKHGADFEIKPQVADPLTFKTTIRADSLNKPLKPLPQAHKLTVQPRNPDLGIKIPQEQVFFKNDVLPKLLKAEQPVIQPKPGIYPKGELPRVREVDIPKRTDHGDVQQHVRTLQESQIVDDTLFNDINDAIREGSFTKPTKSNKTAVEDANFTFDGVGLDESMSKFKSVILSDKKPTSYDIALGNRVLQELQKSGRYDEALNVAIDLSEILSESGRTLQAARIAKRLSPEGRLMIASRTAGKISKKTGRKVNLSDDTIRLISEAKTEKEIAEANQKAAKEIWNQIPANWVDKVNSWRYMAMLFNPKTHVRNIVGNALFLPVREFKNLLGTGLERSLIRKGERTKAVLNPITDKFIMDFAKKDFDNVKAILKNEGKFDDHIRSLDAKVFETKPLEAIRKFNTNAMDVEDTWFMRFAYDSSLAQYMKANKITPVNLTGETLERGRKYAMNEALKATYRDFNSLANIISKGKSNLSNGKYGLLGKAGGVALEGAIPFSKTPLNIIKRGVAYSPANLARGLSNLAKVKTGKVTATEAVDQLASGLSGTGLLALGTWLGYNNVVKGKEGSYTDKLYNYNQMLGSQNYSLNIDGKSYTLDWAAPLSMPFFVGVEISRAIKDNNADLTSVLDAMTQISDPMVNLSMMKGMNDIVKNIYEEGSAAVGQVGINIGTGYLGQFNPTVFGQIARTADDTRRSTTSTNETGLGRTFDKFGRKQLAKLPFASKALQPYVDMWGREQNNGSAAENFLSPGYFRKQNITPVDSEIQSLMSGLSEEDQEKILPASTAYQYTVQANSEKYRMTEAESTEYQKIRGQESFDGLKKLFATVKYTSMSQEEKVKAISDVYSAATDKAKMAILVKKGVSPTVMLSSKQQEKYSKYGKNLNLDEQKFVNMMQRVSGIKGDPMPNDPNKTKLNSESRNKMAFIDSQFPLTTKQQREFLYEMAGVSKTVGHYRPQFD